VIPEFGHFSLVLAACLSLAASVAGLAPLASDNARWSARQTALSLTAGQFVFAGIAFVALVWSFAVDDFSVSYVANHSNSLLPWYYKISATWGGHEGSFLLWIVIMSVWMLLFALRQNAYPQEFSRKVLGILALLNLGFICFALFSSNPFLRLIPMTPADGADLNPLLQDFGLIVHPPLLYAGYVGLAMPFAFAVAALLEGRIDAAWARWARTWTNMAWAFLTVGIALGSWWAYYELGWGGWWFWDPVENASFMPWLAATALLHSLSVTEKRGIFKSWTLLLAIAAFSLSLLGAFIVRSGILTSVHAFAVDPERGLYILIFLGIVIGGSLSLYATRAGRAGAHLHYTMLSREFFMLINNVILVIALAVVLWGTLAPVGYEVITGDRISIGKPFFDRFFVPLTVLLAGSLALLPVLHWKRTRYSALMQVGWMAVAAILCCVLLASVLASASVMVLASVAMAVWLVFTHAQDLIRRLRRGAGIPKAYLGMTLAHFGFAIMIIGVGITSSQSIESDVRMAPQDQAMLGGLEVTFLGAVETRGPNYVAEQGVFLVEGGLSGQFELRPEKRRYLAGGNVMTEAGIHAGLFSDTYIALGEPLGDGAWAVRMHMKPLVRWIWIGALLMALGGTIATLDRRYARLRKRRQMREEKALTAGVSP
tara:strand:+ start:5884 stop:7848 length:1965 start_codon:yes stop_codon:yes gene_type:complete